MLKHLASTLTAGALLAPSLASATEAVAYTYDARGRLVEVVRTVNTQTPVETAYTYDKAGNRIEVATTGAP